MRAAMMVFAASALVGCAALTPMQDGVARFNEGAHTVAGGQMAFFRAVQSADCADQFYARAVRYAVGASDILDLSGSCSPQVLTDRQIAIRQALMDALVLYADKMQALATGGDTALDDDAKKLATKLNGLAAAHGLPGGSGVLTVEAAVTGIAEMALADHANRKLRETAQAMQPALDTLVAEIKAENAGDARLLAGLPDNLEADLHQAVNASRGARGGASFLDILQARAALRAVSPFGVAPVAASATAADPAQDPQNVAHSLNESLDALLAANRALAAPATGGFIAAANNLVARGQHVNTLLAALKQ